MKKYHVLAIIGLVFGLVLGTFMPIFSVHAATESAMTTYYPPSDPFQTLLQQTNGKNSQMTPDPSFGLNNGLATRDSGSNTSGTVDSTGAFRLNVTSTWDPTKKQNDIKLNWDNLTNLSGGYQVQRSTDGKTWDPIGVNYGRKLKILNVCSQTAFDGKWFETWMNQTTTSGDYTGPVDKGLFTITTVSMADFNANPNSYLQNDDGTYKVDGIFFGASDWNSANYDPNNQDLTQTSYDATRAFGNTGRGICFGHDTIEGATWGDTTVPYHTFFNKFASSVGVQVSPTYTPLSGNSVIIDNGGGDLTEHPYYMDPNKSYAISPTHTWDSDYMYSGGGKRWMSFDPASMGIIGGMGTNTPTYLLDANGNKIGDNDWYLVSKTNYSQIQTGHTSGQCTPQEAMIIFNMIYYTNNLVLTNNGVDVASDQAAPNVPTITGDSKQATLTANINDTDNPSTYYYRILAHTSDGDQYSDVMKIPVLSNIKGYIYLINDSLTDLPTATFDATGHVTNVNLPVTDPDTSTSASVPGIDEYQNYNKYIHVLAVDRNDNVSSVKTVAIKDLIPVYEVSGYAFDDSNGNGLADTDESKMAGIPVVVYKINADGSLTQVDTGVNGSDLTKITTNSDGSYDLKMLVNNNYKIGFVKNEVTNGYYPTTPNVGDDPSLNSRIPQAEPITDANLNAKVMVSDPINLTDNVTNLNLGLTNQLTNMKITAPNLDFGLNKIPYGKPLTANTIDAQMNTVTINDNRVNAQPDLSYYVPYQLSAKLGNFYLLDALGNQTQIIGLQQSVLNYQKTDTENYQIKPNGPAQVIYQNSSLTPATINDTYQSISLNVPVKTMNTNDIAVGNYRATLTYTLTNSIA